jgi:Ca-activated chloride channel family protein
MTFIWPNMLWLLVLLPVLLGGYVWLLRRKKRLAVRYANLAMVKSAIGAGGRFRRHVPPVLFLLAVAAMLLATARPAAVVTLPSQHETIVLAMDVSGSMRATDVEPNRLAAAQAAAKAFIDDQPRSVKVGIVAFAGTAAVVQPPTNNREDLIAAIDRFQLQRGTAIGSGIVIALATIFPDAGIELASVGGRRESRELSSPQRPDAKDKPEWKPVPPGSYSSAAIILLTDGQRTTGPDSLEAARFAADRGVRIYTVGVGTVGGTTIGFEGWSMHVKLDEDTLKSIADITRGNYHYAGNAAELKRIYKDLTTRFSMEKKETEITALFAAVGALLATLAAMLSMWWYNRIL